ncbi:MAG: class D beta-lactamase [Deltaproteobacteria bacterium]|nr:class D beta-lactamase [Deltaproteobacteria bacterium]MBF0524637.1 class D beta-lactamase [Deltaproteobacteria bacterium]
MPRIISVVFLLLTVAVVSPAPAQDRDLAEIFKSKQVNGTIVIAPLDGGKTYIHNQERAKTRLIPASTFKIPNTLIALEEGAVADEKQIIKWDGRDKGMAAWNKDQSLETAFPASCVWFYQELAKRVGREKYESYLKKLGYGNAQAGPDLTTFWLAGDLKISAVEQIAFLKKVYGRAYPFKAASYDILRKLMVVQQTPAYTIRAKTGWAQRITPQLGWFVGYVESGDRVWFFATNIDITKPEDSRLRQDVTMEALKLKGII